MSAGHFLRALSVLLFVSCVVAPRFSEHILCAQAPSADQTAQAAYEPHLAFDIISIHESREGNLSYIDNPPQTSYFHAVRARPVGLVLNAYNIHLFQRLKNVPSWAMSIPYDITAKSDDAADQQLASLGEKNFQAEKRHMLRGLLAERFKLQIHTETQTASTYELISTHRTPQHMTLVKEDVAKTISTCNQHFSSKGIEIDAKGCPVYLLLSTISQSIGTDVVDHTGLAGNYAFQLSWSPLEMPQHDDEPFPHLVDALREQLGLELKPTKSQVTIWVIDHMERPTVN